MINGYNSFLLYTMKTCIMILNKNVQNLLMFLIKSLKDSIKIKSMNIDKNGKIY